MPSFVHETVVLWLATLLQTFFRARGGFVAASGLKLAIRPRRARRADVVAFAPGHRPEPRGVVRVPPTVVVEVVAPEPKDERAIASRSPTTTRRSA